MEPGTLFIASDHAGFSLKEFLSDYFQEKGWKVEDLGPQTRDSVDYPSFAHTLCEQVLQTGHKGILICGSGIGMSMAANRHKGIRAALCTLETHARMCRLHNNANVLCLGERITAPALACLLAEIFLMTEFEGGRHQHRIDKIEC
ncbi:ribose 5-phosphate isomerase B [Desulfovibrio sp. OttesenSCG-928-G15]|nr:ribose 5-phosphate isomerase B [Desulfovibrio sp. OttesenSCG-928-G15]